jgi:hypothetical protein
MRLIDAEAELKIRLHDEIEAKEKDIREGQP